MSERLRDHLTCCICLELFRDPKTLPCGHSNCSQCLEQLYQRNEQKLSCVQDRRTFNVRPSDISISIILKQLANEERNRSSGTTPCGSSNKNPLLLSAVMKEELTEVRKLINDGADVNTVDEDGTSVLHLAVQREKVEMVKLLAERGANLEAKNNDGYTPLHRAAIYYNERIVSLLLAKGADIKSTNNGWTVLHYAASYSSLDVMRTMLAHSLEKFGEAGKVAFVNAKNNRGWTALHYAYQMKKMDIVDLLLANGANGSLENI